MCFAESFPPRGTLHLLYNIATRVQRLPESIMIGQDLLLDIADPKATVGSEAAWDGTNYSEADAHRDNG